MPVLTAVDTLGVQRFVFASNRLRDVVGASALVKKATDKATLTAALRQVGANDAEVLFAGGGNALLRLPAREDADHSSALAGARRFAAVYSRWLLEHVPGLEVAVVHHEYQQGGLAQALLDLQVATARAKQERHPSVPLQGLGVTAACRSTGLPAVGVDHIDPTVPVSEPVRAARLKQPESSQIRPEHLQEPGRTQKQDVLLESPALLDELGRDTGRRSLLGVVHVDGNGVGKLITG